MKEKSLKIVKIAGVLIICFIAVAFLYSRMHIDYKVSDNIQESNQRNNQANNSSKSENLPIEEFPEKYQKIVNKSLSFEVEVILPKGYKKKPYYITDAVRCDMDKNKIYQYFLRDSESVSSEVYENQTDLYGKKYDLNLYEDTEGRYLVLEEKALTYLKYPQSRYIINSVFLDPLTDQYNEHLFSDSSDLPFMSRNDSWKRIFQELEQLGIDLENVYVEKCLSLDEKTMQQEHQYIDVDGNVDDEEKSLSWTSDDEGYMYYMRQMYQELPVYGERYVINEPENPGSAPIQLFWNKDGMITLNVQSVFKYMPKNETLELASFEIIMNGIEEKYTGVLMSNPLTVTRARLFIYPLDGEDGIYHMIPIWVCTLREELESIEGETYFSNFQILMDAITGKEMEGLAIQ